MGTPETNIENSARTLRPKIENVFREGIRRGPTSIFSSPDRRVAGPERVIIYKLTWPNLLCVVNEAMEYMNL